MSVLPRCLLGESQLYWLFFNYKIIVAVQTSCPAPADIPSDILLGNCWMAHCRSQYWISAHNRNVVAEKEYATLIALYCTFIYQSKSSSLYITEWIISAASHFTHLACKASCRFSFSFIRMARCSCTKGWLRIVPALWINELNAVLAAKQFHKLEQV